MHWMVFWNTSCSNQNPCLQNAVTDWLIAAYGAEMWPFWGGDKRSHSRAGRKKVFILSSMIYTVQEKIDRSVFCIDMWFNFELGTITFVSLKNLVHIMCSYKIQFGILSTGILTITVSCKFPHSIVKTLQNFHVISIIKIVTPNTSNNQSIGIWNLDCCILNPREWPTWRI